VGGLTWIADIVDPGRVTTMRVLLRASARSRPRLPPADVESWSSYTPGSTSMMKRRPFIVQGEDARD
jgi:hypothetical protein